MAFLDERGLSYFHGKIKDTIIATYEKIFKEVTDARVDYWGKTHGSIKERLDSEFDYAHIQKGKGMFLNYRAVNSHDLKVNGTMDGGVKNLNIKGRTARIKTGEEITVNNSNSLSFTDAIDGTTKGIEVKGKTLQNLIVFNGKLNIGNWNTWPDNRYDIKLFKTNTIYTVICHVYKNTMQNNGSATFVGNTSSPNCLFTSELNGVKITKGITGTIAGTLKTKSDFTGITNIGFWAHDPTITDGQVECSMLILEGDHTVNPPTEYFEGIHSVGQDENKISILSTGKNLLRREHMADNGDQVGISKTFNADGTILLNGTATAKSDLFFTYNISSSQYVKGISVTPGYRYQCKATVLSGTTTSNIATLERLPLRDGEKWSGAGNINESGNINYIRYVVEAGEKFENCLIGVQLEQSEVVTKYEPPKSDKKDILLPSSMLGLNEWDYVQNDEIVQGGMKKGLSDFRLTTINISQEFDGIIITPINEKKKNKDKSGFICNVFPSGNVNTINSLYSNPANFVAVKEKGYTAEMFRNDYPNFELIYELEAPIIHKLEPAIGDKPGLETFEGLTNVSVSNSVISPASMSIGYPVKEVEVIDFCKYGRLQSVVTEGNKSSALTSVGEAEGGKISILSTSRNLVDVNKIISDAGLDINNISTADAMKIPPFYYFKDNIAEYTFEYNVNLITEGTPLMVVKRKDGTVAKYVENKHGRVVVRNTDSTLSHVEFSYGLGCYFKINKLEISEGNNVNLPYEPCKSDKKDILLPFDGGLKGVGVGSEDIVELSRITQKCNKFNLLDIIDTYFHSFVKLTTVCRLSIRVPDSIIKSYGINTRCNMFKQLAGYELDEEHYYADNKVFNFYIELSKLPTQNKEGAKKWLETNIVEVVYELETPIIHEIAPVGKLSTFRALTTVLVDSPTQPTEFSGDFPIEAGSAINNVLLEAEEIKLENATIRAEQEERLVAIEDEIFESNREILRLKGNKI